MLIFHNIIEYKDALKSVNPEKNEFDYDLGTTNGC